MKSKREGLVLYNGRIYTQEKKFPLVSALAVQGKRIIGLGKDAITRNYPSNRFRKINLKKKTVLPAFCDSHAHFLGYVQDLAKLDLEKAKSLAEVLELIRKFSQKKKPGEWIFGYNWDANLWKEPLPPDKKALDQISSLSPVALSARDGHQLWVNSLALKMAGIDQSSGEISGGQIVRYQDSQEPSGVLKDNARKAVEEITPEEVQPDLVKKALKNLHRKGITAIHNMENGKSLSFFQQLESREKLALRVWQTISRDNLDNAIRAGLRTGFGSDKLRIGGVKIFADGALGSRTALMFEPYENEPDNFGLEIVSCDELVDLIKRGTRSGIAPVIHAIGDKANHNALRAIQAANEDKLLRPRIEHAQIVRPEDLDLFATLNVVASFQPIHCPNDYQMAVKHWGKRNLNSYPIGTLLKKNVKVCFGSDFPLYDSDPILGIYCAVNRTLPKSGHPAWNPSQKITVGQAVTAYTKAAAYAAGWEDSLGTLAVGKLTDLIVLSDNIYERKSEQIHNIKVLATLFDGHLVWGELY